MTTKHKVFVATGVAVVLLGLMFFSSGEKPITVAVKSVEKGAVEAIVVNTRAGTVKACRRAKISPALGGQVAYLYVSEGQTVQSGQALLALWNEDLEAQIRLARDETATVRAKGHEACILSQVAQREAKRLLKLKARNLAAEDDVDRAVTQARASEAGCLASQAQVVASDAKIDVVRAALERTVLKAPFAGRIAEVNAEVGEFVTPSPPGIATPPTVDLIDVSCLLVSAPIDEVDAGKLRDGLAARVKIDAYPDEQFSAQVKRIAPYVQEFEKQARTVEVEARFDDPQSAGKLLPGYSADVEIVIGQTEAAIRIPTEAVKNGDTVFVFNQSSGRVEERKIQTGLSNWAHTEVRSGIKAGEQVVISLEREGLSDGVLAETE